MDKQDQGFKCYSEVVLKYLICKVYFASNGHVKHFCSYYHIMGYFRGIQIFAIFRCGHLNAKITNVKKKKPHEIISKK